MDKEILNSCEIYGKKFGVCPKISESDHLLRFLIENCSFNNKDDAVKYYFEDGFRSANKFKDIINIIYPDKNIKLKILEFASGYGMVTRFFKKVLPYSDITACDIHEDAVNFIREELGVPAVLSNSIPEKLDVPLRYDVIFALSFFSHMPKETWLRWVKALVSKVSPGGFLIFTTHGCSSREKLITYANIDKEGFWFSPDSEQKDLDTNEYGTAVTTPQFVFNQLNKLENCRIVEFREAFWWEHQDLYVVRVIS